MSPGADADALRGALMLRVATTVTALALLAAATLPAAAGHCAWRSISEPEIQQSGYYVDNDLCQPECIVSVWVYEESNGISGLQRHDEVQDDTCGGEIAGDTLVAGGMPLSTDLIDA